MGCCIKAIEYHLPEGVLSNSALSEAFPGWSAEKILDKTGISERRIAAEHECASDLGVAAARKLFASGACRPEEIDFLIFCTQTPDYLLPTTACLVQEVLGLPQSVGALDVNLGCSGYVYGLGLALGLIATGQARNILFITADTYSKLIHPGDRSIRTLFGDAAAATLVSAASDDPQRPDPPGIGPFVFGTDGQGAPNLIVPTGGLRQPRTAGERPPPEPDESGNLRTPDNLYMNGAEIFNFTLRAVPRLVASLLAKASLDARDVDLFVFHQANLYMLEHLRKKIEIPREKFSVAMAHCGNTVSSSIPIALKDEWTAGRLHPGARVVLVGFGVGYSWGATLVRW